MEPKEGGPGGFENRAETTHLSQNKYSKPIASGIHERIVQSIVNKVTRQIFDWCFRSFSIWLSDQFLMLWKGL
jgi:hypothetical protein